jgi:hypothetical protein
MDNVEFAQSLALLMNGLTYEAGSNVSKAFDDAEGKVENAPQWLIEWAEDYDNVPDDQLNERTLAYKKATNKLS